MSTMLLPLLLLSLLAVGFVVVPLWRQRGGTVAQLLAVREQKNREVFEQRQVELANEVQTGVIAQEDYERLLAELQRAFLTDMQALNTAQPVSSNQASLRWLPVLLALLVPAGALWTYSNLGSAPDLALPAVMQKVANASDEASQKESLTELASFLEQRFQRRPDDLQNGYMLGTLYLGIERYQDAVTTFEKMLQVMEPNPDRATVLGQLAQAKYLAADSQITDDVQKTMDEATALNANEQAVMSLYAIDAFLKQDFVTALKYWRRQLAELTPGSADAESLRQRITALETNLPKELQEAARGPTITVVVDIAPALKEKVTAGMRLYVFARNPAVPPPIVAKNLDVTEFPLTLTLDNSMSMTGMQLESAPQLIVGARLSASGNPVASSGDLQTLSTPFVLADQTAPLTLTIDSVVP